MIADLHRVFVPFHRNSSSFGIQCLVKIYEFVEEQRILASMSRTRDSVLQFRPVILVVCSFPLVQCPLQPSVETESAFSHTSV